ncbi:DEKNAAC100194 [Brettanomyces naardenensis]|uniref:DEKNAAC100194 n=1 Tax=Brettanomyces naardenensis TaxID=13370 RepID=A0A448YEQ2_BRENA|nr:DEKNAAC100194 [Brettanomyces naardenensis]
MFRLALSRNLLRAVTPSLRTTISISHGYPASTALRSFRSFPAAFHGEQLTKPKPGEELHITFILKDGSQRTYEVSEGDSILDIAQANGLDMEGACGGSCACSTCHVIVDPDFYDKIPEPDDDENDMLDLAFGLTETSRLGCQVHMTKDLDGIRVALPAMTRNMQNKDFK